MGDPRAAHFFMALPREQRIRRTGEFVFVREKGQSRPGRWLILAVAPLPGEARARFGFTVSKRVGNAVTRNLIRRRLSAIAARSAGQIQKPCLIVTVARHTAAAAAYSELEAEWLKLTRRAGLLPPPRSGNA